MSLESKGPMNYDYRFTLPYLHEAKINTVYTGCVKAEWAPYGMLHVSSGDKWSELVLDAVKCLS